MDVSAGGLGLPLVCDGTRCWYGISSSWLKTQESRITLHVHDGSGKNSESYIYCAQNRKECTVVQKENSTTSVRL
jgi:hypothetical protein